MKNKKSLLWFLGVLVLLLGLTGCDTLIQGPHGTVNYPLSFQGSPGDEVYLGDPQVFILWGGQHIEVGTVTVGNNADFLFITYKTIEGWYLTDLHLYVLEEEPTNRLNPGHAPYKEENLPEGTQDYTLVVPFEDLGNLEALCGLSLWLQAKANVENIVDGNLLGGETAYGGDIKGSPWYGNIEYIVQCDNGENGDNGDWQTETAWGGNTSGSGAAWWYYYDASTEGEQTIWAGQDLNAGTVELNGGTIEINLLNGWELQDVVEPVKIQGYEDIPNSRPAAGLFTTYKGSELSVSVKEFPFYAIHLDVQKQK